MKVFLKNILVFLIPFVVTTIILWAIPYPRKFAYHYIQGSCFNRGQYVYDRIFESKRPVDIAFIGTSHTMNAVNDSLIEKIMNKNSEHPFYVANIAYCWEGVNGQYVVIKDLIEQKKPNVIVFEVREHEHNSSHEIFPYFCDTHDALVQPYLTNVSCLPNLYKSTIARFNLFKEGNRYLDVSPDTSIYFGRVLQNDVADPLELGMKKSAQQRNYGPGGRLLNYHMKSFSRYYFDRIIALCRENNVKLYFLYLPAYGDILHKPVDAIMYSENGTLILPPMELCENDSVWANASHLNGQGMQAVSEWLGNYFIDELNE